MILRPAAFPVTHVVVGIDGSPGSEAALHWAAAEAVRCQTGLRIVSAWQDPARAGSSPADHPAQAAAHILQNALARILSQQHYPRRIACAALSGTPGEALLTQARGTGLLVLGATGAGLAQLPGATGRYCLQHGSGPLVIVPATPSPQSQPRLEAGRGTALAPGGR
jgi:nucleotide-binding universal stress UspA family protein